MPEALLNPYCSESEVRDEIRNTDAAIQDTLIRSINSATLWIDDYTRRTFAESDYSESALVLDEFDGVVFGNQVFLPKRPVIEITELKLGEQVLTEGEDFVVKPEIIYRVGGDWKVSTPDALIRIKGRFGYPQRGAGEAPQLDRTIIPTGLPGNIRRAAVLVAAAFSGYDRKEIVGLDGQFTSIADRAIPKEVKEMLGVRMPMLT